MFYLSTRCNYKTIMAHSKCEIFSLLHLIFVALYFVATNGMLVQRERFPGVWKLFADCLPYEKDIRSKLLSLMDTDKEGDGQDALLKLNPDGTFRQCSEDYKEGRWISGKWKLKEGQPPQLLLAFNRQYYGPRFDLLLEGDSFCSERQLEVTGTVQKGKFMYPQKHPSFFENMLIDVEVLGQFSLQQVISTSSVVKETEPEEVELDMENHFQVSDFHEQNFIMTVEALVPKNKARNEVDQPVDIRSMPLQFYQNNTFQARGINKTLRGRFQVTEANILTFDVSLFGAERSSPGSVYSEGLGLSHDDERSYRGAIQRKRDKLFVVGVVMFGMDLGPDARPEPCGNFVLTQVDQDPFSLDGDHDDDDLFDSIFE